MCHLGCKDERPFGDGTMILGDLVARFETHSPMCVMMRGLLENVFAAERLNALFERTARQQFTNQLLFSTVADVMGLVACRIHPSVHAAYQSKLSECGVTVKAIYDKLRGIEGNVSREMVRETGAQMAQIIDSTKATLPPLVKGYQVKIVDGSHLRRTQRRIGELRVLNSAPLPGHAVVVLDPERKLVVDAIPCEDAYAQERTLLPELLETIEAKNLVIADRNFCTAKFLLPMIARQAAFVIREHGKLRYQFRGKRKKVKQTDSGIVYEQAIEMEDEAGTTTVIRRVTVELFEKTRNGDSEIHILTNLPPRIRAVRVAELYRHRWKIEHAFLEVQQNLEGEIETLGYPKAALFSHCMALVSYNVMSVLQAALRAAHGTEKIEEEVSVYYVADEIAHTYRGLEIAIPESYWKKQYASLSPRQMARALIAIAAQINLGRYRKHKRGPKKKAVPMNKKHRAHVSTSRILAQRKAPVT